MAKSKQPLTIWIDDQWRDHEVVKKWEEEGHNVLTIHDPDLILSPNAWQWDDSLWRYADVAIKEARRRKANSGIGTNVAADKGSKRSAKK